MATYIPQVQGYVPQYQPFKPDFNFYAGALQMKQSQYDSAHKQLSTLYTSLLNSPLTRDGNVQKRDEIFNMINQDIKKISSVDLSLAENVSAARKVFDPIYNDDNIVKDMAWTKNFMNALNTAESFKGCVDPKKCGGQYWDTGVQALYYRRDEFKNASDADALKFGDVSFTPYVNVHEKAVALAKEAGLNVKQDFNTGQWIITKKNGELVQGGLYNLFNNVLGSDPKIQEMYQTGAYVKRKSFIEEKTASGEYATPEEAEMAYINSILATGNKAVDEQKTNVSNANDQMSARRAELLEKQRTTGLTYAELDALKEIEEKLPQTQAAQDNLKTVSNAMNNKTSDDIKSLRSRADAAAAHVLSSYDFTSAAQTLSLKDAEQTMKENPYAMATHQADLSLRNSKEMSRINYENRINEMIMQNKLDMGRDQFKYQLEMGMFDDSFVNPGGGQGGPAGNPDIQSDASWSTEELTKGGENQDVVYKKNVETAAKLNQGVVKSQGDFLLDVYRAASNAKTPGATQAINKIFSSMLGQKNGKYANTEEGARKLIEDMSKYSPSTIDRLYNNAVAETTKNCPTCDNSWAATFMKENYPAETLNQINIQKQAAAAVNKKVQADLQAIVRSVKGQQTDESKSGDVPNIYADADLMMKGNFLTDKESFVKAYINKHKNDPRYNPQERTGMSELWEQVTSSFGNQTITKNTFTSEQAAQERYYDDLYKRTGDKSWLDKKNAFLAKVKDSYVPFVGSTESWNLERNVMSDAEDAFEALTDKILVDYNGASERHIPLDQGYSLKGGGTYSANVLVYNNVDASKPLAGPVTNARNDFKTFANNSWRIGQGDSPVMRLGFGDPTADNMARKGGFEEVALSKALQIINFDLQQRWKKGDKKRPIFTYKESPIAANNAGMSARTIIFSEEYQKKLVGSEKNPGVMWGHADDLAKGISVYYDNNVMKLGSDIASETTNLDYIARFDPEGIKYNIPNGGNIRIKTNPDGSISATGTTTMYQNGVKIQDAYVDEWPQGTTLETATNEVKAYLFNIKQSNDSLDEQAAKYNALGLNVAGYHPPVKNP